VGKLLKTATPDSSTKNWQTHHNTKGAYLSIPRNFRPFSKLETQFSKMYNIVIVGLTLLQGITCSVFLASSISVRIRPFFWFSAVCKFARKKVFHSWIETLKKIWRLITYMVGQIT
jgi:hypothetical protein